MTPERREINRLRAIIRNQRHEINEIKADKFDAREHLIKTIATLTDEISRLKNVNHPGG